MQKNLLKIFVFFLILSLPTTLFGNVMTGLSGSDYYELTFDVFDIAGSTDMTGGGYTNYSSLSQPSGVTQLANGITTLDSGYYSMDIWSPSDIDDLTALTGTYPGEIDLSWSAPGNDFDSGDIYNGKFRIDYSSETSHQFGVRTYKIEIDTSTSPDDMQSYTLTGLTENTTYYIRVYTADESSNWGGLSNGATTWAQVTILSISISPDTYDFGNINLDASTNTLTAFTVTNEGNVNETYSLRVSSVTLYNNDASLWISTDTTTGHNRFILYSIFHGTDVALGYFELSDAVVVQNRSSTSTRYTYEGGSTGYEQTGVGVEPNEERKMWFRLDMPVSASSSQKEKISITVTAGPE